MRGHITKRSENSYTIVVNLGIDPSTGKRKQQWLSVKGSKRDAEKRLGELLRQIDIGAFIKPGKTTLGEFLDTWLKSYVRANLAPRTVEGYQGIIDGHLKPAMGQIPLTQLRPDHLQRYYADKLSSGLSAQSIRHDHTLLHKALQTAIEWNLLSRNVADAVKPPRVQQLEMQIWDEDDINTFLEAAKETPYYALFYTAFYTGMRRSELLALRWSDVDFLFGQVYVNRSLHHLRDGSIVFRPPKTAKGRRTIALPPSAILVLKEHKKKQELDQTMLGLSPKDDDLVFSQLEGKPLLPDSVTHAWIKLVRRTRLKPIRLHDARHSHASILLKQGIHPKIVQERLGHASIQITLDTYSHVAPGLQQAAAESFDKLLNHKPQDETVENLG